MAIFHAAVLLCAATALEAANESRTPIAPKPSAAAQPDAKSYSQFVQAGLRLHKEGRDAEAERAARNAIELNKLDTSARYLLGVSLAAQSKNPQEALENLRAAASDFPDAYLEITRILIENGDFESAMKTLQMFLKKPRVATVSDQLLAK